MLLKSARLAAASLLIACAGGDSAPGSYSTPEDEAAKVEFQRVGWVRDVYISPGVMNLGVIRGDKLWGSPMIGTYSCAILRKHGSRLRRVRFVDIEAVVNEGKSPRSAQIAITDCPASA